MVWTDWGIAAPSTGHISMSPVPSHRTMWSCPHTVFTVHSTLRSGSMTGWAVDMIIGSTGWGPSASNDFHWLRCPTSPRNSRVTGSTSTGRPTSQVVNRRSPHTSGAVLAALLCPNGELTPIMVGVNTSGRRALRRADGESMRRARQANRSVGAPWVPG